MTVILRLFTSESVIDNVRLFVIATSLKNGHRMSLSMDKRLSGLVFQSRTQSMSMSIKESVKMKSHVNKRGDLLLTSDTWRIATNCAKRISPQHANSLIFRLDCCLFILRRRI